MQSRIYGQYTPTTIDMLLDWLTQHPDAYLFTDMKYNQVDILTQLAEISGPLQDRIVPQIYHFSEYEPMRELGYDNLILTLYRLHGSISSNAELIRDYALRHRLLGITFDKSLLSREYTAILAESGAAVFTHTITSPEEAEACYALGATGVYLD